jgi:ankyrin repeat protein
VPLLRRYIKAGITVNAANFDQRTALHVAAAEGNLAAVRRSCFGARCMANR